MTKHKPKEFYKENIRESVMDAIFNREEFAYLERICLLCDVDFDEEVINYSLDAYSKFREKDRDVFSAKYLSLCITTRRITGK